MTKETLCVVRTIDGVQYLFMPDGTKIPFVAMTRATQDCQYPGCPISVAIVKMFVWLEDSVPIIAPLITSELDEKSKTWLRDIPDHADNPAKTENTPLDS